MKDSRRIGQILKKEVISQNKIVIFIGGPNQKQKENSVVKF